MPEVLPVKKRIALDQLGVGQSVPWNCYSEDGVLLLRRGQIVESQRVLERLIEDGLFLQQNEYEHDEVVSIEEKPSALQYIHDARHLLASLYCTNAVDTSTDFVARMDKVIHAVQSACDAHARVSLSSILLLRDATPYIVKHPIDVAILTNILAQALSLNAENRRMTVAAALTMNIGMVEVQEKIQAIHGPLNEKLLTLIRAHPAASEQRLNKLGVTDREWLALVRHHHEHQDGSGYPAHLAGDVVEVGARIIALADMYCAMVSGRADRPAQKPPMVIRELYAKHGPAIDAAIAGKLVRVLGLYPVGTLVRLVTSEIGVVTGPGEGAETPEVHAIISRNGAVLEVASHRKTHLSKFAIEEVITIDSLTVPVRMTSLWGRDAKVR
jgi:HD-GYP domain-containing protein (c-di-GMP phosphodiesterase class II)